jgi:hypothetical protein
MFGIMGGPSMLLLLLIHFRDALSIWWACRRFVTTWHVL